MKKNFLRMMVGLAIALTLTACQPLAGEQDDSQLGGSTIVTSTMQHTAAATQTSTQVSTITSTPSSKGPLLLIQTDVDQYQIIDFARRTTAPFDPPGQDRQYNLINNLSPNGSQMLFPISEDEVVVMSLSTGKVHTTYNLHSDSSRFQPELAALEAILALPGLKYSEEAMLSAVKEALIQSKLNIQWYQSDRYRLSVIEGAETSTHLTLDDHQTGMREQLEQMPGLVEDYWAAPEGEYILLKKGYVFEPGVWQDDRYYLVDKNLRTATPLPLLADADHPSIFWFSPEFIGILHQPKVSGGVNFSLVDVNTKDSRLVVAGHFNGIMKFGTHLLTIHQDQDACITTLAMRMFDGKITQSQELEGICFVSTIVDANQLLINCENESFLVEEDTLLITPFGDRTALFAQSPDRAQIVLVTQAQEATLLNAGLEEQQILELEDDPVEIRWLPDSSGFLYRTANRLYHYDLASDTSRLLLVSDLFADYRNLNAVWVNVD